MSSWTSYPKVWNLGHRHIAGLLDGDVIVEEKVDGSQFSFGVFMENGERVLRVRSKGVEMNVDAPEKMFSVAVETVRRLEGNLVLGWTYRAEYLQKPKHNALAYDRVPKGNLIIFDVATGPDNYAGPVTKEVAAHSLGLEVVPVLFRGRVESADQLRELLDTTSILGGQKIEGVVIKNHNKFGDDGKPLLGKFVSEKYREIQKVSWKVSNPTSRDILTMLIDAYKTPSRFAKATQHLREAGLLTDSPKDIGPLIHEVQRDVGEEEEQAIKDRLFAWAWPHIRRGITGGLPEWYKGLLLEKQFDKPEES